MAHSITLQRSAAGHVVDNDILGQISFASPNEPDGTDAIAIAASIFARSEGTFAADNNATELVFLTGATESAAPHATTYDMTLSSAGLLTIAGNLVIPDGGNIGSASDTNAIAIASDGVVTMDQIPVFSAGINVSGGTIAGTLATAAQTNITTVGTLVGLTVEKNAGLLASFKRITGAGNAYVTIDASAVNADEEAQLRLKAGVSGKCRVYFGDTDDNDIGQICYEHATDEMGFKTNNATAMTIAAEGDVTFSKAIKPAAPAAASGTSGIVVLDCDTTNHFTITTGAAITGWNFTNASVGQRIIVRVTNGASHTVGFSATGDGDVVYFPGGTEPTLTVSGGIDVYGFLCIASDTFDGFIIGQDIKA